MSCDLGETRPSSTLAAVKKRSAVEQIVAVLTFVDDSAEQKCNSERRAKASSLGSALVVI